MGLTGQIVVIHVVIVILIYLENMDTSLKKVYLEVLDVGM